jgi:hypothetical protein
LKNKKLNLVKLADSASKIVSNGDLKADIILLLNGLSNLQQLKSDKLSTIVKYVCELIENSDYKTKNDSLKLDKKQIAIDTLTSVFADLNNDSDKKRLSDLVDFVCESGLINKIPTSTICAKKTISWILKKVN